MDSLDRSLTQEIVRELLDYDPGSGCLTWRERDRKWFKTDRVRRAWNSRYAGKPAGYIDNRGYVGVRIFNRAHAAHRVIWLWMTGEFPAAGIDHKNHVKDCNRWSNLRSATQSENCKNTSLSRRNTSGVLGVFWHKGKSTWAAQIVINKRTVNLGFFHDKNAAVAARKDAERLHGFHPNHGRMEARP